MAVVEAFSLGGVDAPETSAFIRVPPLEVGPDGSLFLLARSANEVRRFGPDGTFLNTIGREGEGPGEFQNAYLFGLVGDTIWVRNLSPPSVSYFTSDGEYLRTDTYRNPTISRNGIPDGPEAILGAGSWFMVGAVPFGGPRGPVDVPLLIVRPGDLRDTLATAIDPTSVYLPDVGTFGGIRPYPLHPLYDVVPGGEAVLVAEWGGEEVAEGAFSLRRFRPDGTLDLDSTVRFAPVPLLARVADSIVAAAADSVSALVPRLNAELPADLEEVIRAQLALGNSFPPIKTLLAGVDGTIWVERVIGPSSAEWVVLDNDGRPQFRVVLAEGITLGAASDDALWTTRTDAFDVPYVVRYDLVDDIGGA